jgi:predicted Rossmann fold nucleotide-binding protein DprA/Smf involved in DNA uptake
MAPSEVKPLSAREFWPLLRRVDLSGLAGKNADDVAREASIPIVESERLLALLDRSTAVALAMERLEQAGVWTLTPEDESYPKRLVDRLADAAPPVLHGVGDASALLKDGIGIVGSRNITADGADAARQASVRAVQAGLAVVSGAARGVDQQAMAAAFQAGGGVVGILAEALMKVIRQADMRSAVHGGLVTLVTPYSPDAGFSPANAMGRNKLIYALARKTLVVATDEGRGGTWAGATEALRATNGEVLVWNGPGKGPGNDALAELGATPIDELDALITPPRPDQPRIVADQLTMNF